MLYYIITPSPWRKLDKLSGEYRGYRQQSTDVCYLNQGDLFNRYPFLHVHCGCVVIYLVLFITLFYLQAGLLRTEHGEYWIEPSKQIPKDSSEPRPHVIFRRSAVDKVEAWHRAKREVDNRMRSNPQMKRNNHEKNMQQYYNKRPRPNARRYRENKEIMDKRRREYLEQRRRRMEMMRKNPAEYRRHQNMLRMEERRLQQSNSKSNSIESSRSSNQASMEARRRNRNRLSDEQRLRRVRNRRRRKRSKNCATKQPTYQWRRQNLLTEKEAQHHKDHSNKVGKNYNIYIYRNFDIFLTLHNANTKSRGSNYSTRRSNSGEHVQLVSTISCTPELFVLHLLQAHYRLYLWLFIQLICSIL